MKLTNLLTAIKELLMPTKAMPLTDKWLEQNKKELRKKMYEVEPPVKVWSTFNPIERNSNRPTWLSKLNNGQVTNQFKTKK